MIDWWKFCKSSLQLDTIDYSKSKRKALCRKQVSSTNHTINLKQFFVQSDMSIAAEISSLEALLEALHLYDLEGVKVRSRIHWLEEGEKLTHFFFQLKKEQAAKHIINSVFHSQGVEVSSHAVIEQAHGIFTPSCLLPSSLIYFLKGNCFLILQ